MELPISLKIANTKGKILSTVNMASVEYNLPAFILEGILSDVMLEISSQAKIEMLNDVNRITDEKKENAKEE
ncbi:MAG: hypothetical protein V8P98_04500 [Acutalibacteraceae bacterium]|jgi:hypothetical protein